MRNLILTFVLLATSCVAGAQQKPIMKELTPFEKHVIIDKGTEAPFTGEYTDFKGRGTYHCRQCDAPLYRSEDKFHSGCGWPSFDDEIPGAVKRTVDADGRRTEITCSACEGHLGHVFLGEGFTDKDTRHCVNSVSLRFVPENADNDDIEKTAKPQAETAIFAGGCFWGVEHLLQQVNGVIDAESGYIGGHVENPTYEQVCTGRTGHAEAVRVVFDPSVVSYEDLVKYFLEIHDPTQVDRQGPDIGSQYRSEIFYTTPEQEKTARDVMNILTDKGYTLATKLTPATEFYTAEDYHQDYTAKSGRPACHIHTKRF